MNIMCIVLCREPQTLTKHNLIMTRYIYIIDNITLTHVLVITTILIAHKNHAAKLVQGYNNAMSVALSVVHSSQVRL